MRFDSISVLGAVRHRALTPAPALHHTQYGLSPFLTPPARRNAVLTIRATYCIWFFWTYFFGFYTYTASCANPYRLHRVCTITAQSTFHRSCGQALSIFPYSIRTDLFHTTFQNFTNSSQTRHKLVTSDLQSHVQKRIQPRYLYKRRLIHSIWTYAQPACIHRLGLQFNSIYSQTTLSLLVTRYTNSLIIRLYTEFKLVRFKRPAKNSLNKFYTLPTL